MVLNVSGSEEFDDEEDTTEESGVFYGDEENFIDSDMSDLNMTQGPALANPRITNLFSTQRSWRVLRLPGGRAGEEGAGGLRGFTNFMLQIIPGWRGQTIRDSPFRQMVTARMWQQYINNMEPIDDALELQAPYSPEELLSLRMFCEEWTNDPGHIQFTRRLSTHPSTNNSDAVLKGNMVYDICTGQIQLRTARGGRGDGNIPIRLAHDILTSIPFTVYNFYTLNSVHAQEGAAVYEGFLNRYVRLSSTEVAMVEEIENGIRGGGRGYATMSTNITGDPIEAFALMQQVIEAMELGDTLTVRAHINALLSPPYNYKSMAQQIDVGGTHGGRFVTGDQVRYHQFNAGNLTTNATTNNNTPMRLMYRQGRNTAGELVMWPDNQPRTAADGHPPLGFYMEVNQNGIGVANVWEVFQVGSNKHIRVADYDSQARAISEMVGGFNNQDRQRRDDRAPGGAPDRDAADRRRGVRGGGPRVNPTRSNKGHAYYPYPPEDFAGKPSLGLFGKAVEIEPVPKTEKGKFAIVYTENNYDWFNFFLVMGLGTKTKAWLKKNEDDWAQQIFDDLLPYVEGYKKVLPKRAAEVREAFLEGGHKSPGEIIIFKDSAIMSYDNTIINANVAEKLINKGLALLDEMRDTRSNPDCTLPNGMTHTFSVPSSFKVDVRRFGSSTSMGRGKFIYVQVLPKTQVEFTGKYRGSKKQTQYWEQGGTKTGDKTGLNKVYPGGISGDGYFIKTALHKRTGVEVPWLVGLPRKDFQAFTDSEGRRTIRPKRRKAEADPAWERFTRYYGIPTYKGGTKGKQNLFAIKSSDGGRFYDELRSKPTKR